MRYNNCGAVAAAEVLEQQRRMMRNPGMPNQFSTSSCAYPKRNPGCINERGEDHGMDGSTTVQPKPPYLARKVAAGQNGTGSHWY